MDLKNELNEIGEFLILRPLLYDDRINFQEKIILSTIMNLDDGDGVKIKNHEFADMLRLTSSAVKQSITRLRRFNFIYSEGHTYRRLKAVYNGKHFAFAKDKNEPNNNNRPIGRRS